MSKVVENELVKASWVLSKSNPALWDRFLVALEDYTKDRIQRAICAPASELYVTVGMARQAGEFNENMHTLDKLYDVIRTNEAKRG